MISHEDLQISTIARSAARTVVASPFEDLLSKKLEFMFRGKDGKLLSENTYLIIYDERGKASAEEPGQWLYAEWSAKDEITMTDKQQVSRKGDRVIVATGSVSKKQDQNLSIKINRVAVGLVEGKSNLHFIGAALLGSNGKIVTKVGELGERKFCAEAIRFKADSRAGITFSTSSLT